MLAACSVLVYLFEIVRRTTRPHRVSWGVWTLIGFLGVAGTFSAGAGLGVAVFAIDLAGGVVVFALSLTRSYGKPGGHSYDIPLGAAAVVILILWQVSHWPPLVAVLSAALADALVSLLTLRDAWRAPQSESTAFWSLGSCAAWLGVLVVHRVTASALIYPVYVASANTLIAGALGVRCLQRRRA